MNLLDTASLVVTPNGYKASKLYSIVPSDGTGDMTFARTGDTATRVNSSGLIETVLANKPRLDYLGGGCPKLLLEPQRTNLLNYSDAFDNAQWTKGELTVTANSTASPDGTTNADSLTETAANDYHITYQAKSLTTATTYTFSVFVKPNGRNFARMLFGNGPFPDNQYVYFNLVTDEIVKTASVTAKIETYANGWKRCIATCTADASSSDAVYFGPARNTTDGYVTYAGNASLGIFAYGAQLEAGAYATSYIPTTTASVTRNADTCSKSSATALIGQTEGTILLKLNVSNLESYTRRIFTLSDSTTNNIIGFQISANLRRIVFYVTTSGVDQAVIISSDVVFNLNQDIAIAAAYKANDFVLYVNGVQIGTDNSGTIPTCSAIKFSEANDSAFYLGKVNSVLLWKTRLTNQELVTLTTI
jgi:hypothetical protein